MKLFRAIHIKKRYLLGALVLVGAVGACSLFLPPATAKVSAILNASNERKLPIYCVETDKKQVSVSFDAAWGAGHYGRKNLEDKNGYKCLFYAIPPYFLSLH